MRTKNKAATKETAARTGSEAAQFNGFPVTIEIFEGPLDLLLYLVRRQEVDIAEVRLAEITGQFLAYLRTMAELNIQYSADFVVMAATLMLIKSQALLPINPADVPAEIEEIALEEAEENLETQLQRRLQEYRIYREAAQLLEESQKLRSRIFLRPAEEGAIGAGFVTLEEVSIFDMIAAVQEMLQRAKPEPPAKIRRPAISVSERLEEILMQLAAEQRAVYFTELIVTPATRLFIIVTFLAILELVRRRRVRIADAWPRRDFAIELLR